MRTQQADVIFETGRQISRTSVIVPLYNYAHHIEATLESVLAQSDRDVSLIVVDDCSTDRSIEVVSHWMRRRSDCGMGLKLIRNRSNARLAITRNTGISCAQSDYCFMLDADNLLYPRCIEKHAKALDARPDVGAAYSLLEVFEGRRGVIGAGVFLKPALIHGNFIDAMAIFRRSLLLEFDGYEDIQYGWEDYDLWLRMSEAGKAALHIPEITARYRQHNTSMLRTETNIGKNINELHKIMKKRHPWLDLH